MAQNQVYLIKSGENSFVEETQAIVGISGGKVGIGTTHPEADLHVTGSVKVGGDLTVDGTLTTINSSTVSVDDINIELGNTDNPTDATAEGGGITVKGTTDKTFNWHTNGGWTSSENLSVADGKHFAGDELRALDAGGLSLFDNNQSGITIKGGKVGVHQTAPVYDLDVDGSGNFGSLYVDGNSVLTGEGSVFGKWEDGATEGEIFYTGGNVGVGTTNPEHNFHVVGNSVVDGNFIVNGTSGTFNVDEFDVSGSNITLNSAGGGLDSSRGGLIVNGDSGTGKLEYLDSTQTWQSNQDIQIVADKHLQTDKVRAIDDGGLYLQDDGGNGIHIQDGGQVNIAGLTKANGGLNVGNGKFDIQSDGTLGSVNPNNDDVIKWDGTKWVAAVSPGGGGGGTSEVPNALINSLIAGESIQEITYGPYDSTPRIATDLEIIGDGSVIPYALSGVSETGYFAVFSQEIPNNNYKIHTVFGGKDVYWETGSSSSIYYNDGDVSLQRNLTVGGNLTVAGNTTTLNTQTLEIKDHNIVIASNTGYNQLTNVYPAGGDYAGVFWGTGDAGAASPVSLTYQSNKGFAFEGGSVGIGTASPDVALHVFSGADNDNTILESSDTAVTLTLKDSTGAAKIESRNDFRFSNNAGADEIMRLTAGGNVGIGTTDPSAPLTICGSPYPYMSFDNTQTESIDGTSLGALFFKGKRPNGTVDTGVSIRGRGAGEASNLNNDVPAELVFATNPGGTGGLVERMLIDSVGNVGIGTPSPDGTLHVTDFSVSIGNINVTDTGTGLTAGTSLNTKISNGDRIKINNQIFTVSNVQETTLTLSGTPTNGGTFAAYTDNNALVVTSAGNVGIGTTGPVSEFQVGDKVGGDPSVRTTLASFNAADNAYLEIENTETKNPAGIILTNVTTKKWTIAKEGDNHHLYIKDAGDDNVMTFLQGGNVGIGTTDPSASLTIESEGSDTPMQGSHLLDIKSTGNSKLADIRLSAKDSAGALRAGGLGFNADDNVVYLANNGVQYLNVGNNGNVGIGTTDPISKLHVDSGEAELTFGNNASGGNANLRIWRNDSDIAINNPLGYLSFAGSDAATSPTDHAAISAVAEETHEYTSDPLSEKNGTQLRFFTTNLGQSAMSQKMTISANGNVGIGTTSPARLLHLKDSNSAIAFETKIDYNGSAFAQIKSGRDGAAGYSSTLEFATTESTTAVPTFGSNGTGGSGFVTRMLIDSAGNVGIGTTSPSAKLEIETTSQNSDTILNLAWSHYNDTTNIEQRIGWSFGDDITISKPSETAYIAAGKQGTYGVQQQRSSYLSFATEHGVQQVNFGGTEPNYAPVERMRIAANGNVGIGTTSPGSYKLNVNGDVFASSYTPTSDDRVKHNEQPIVGALETLSKVTPKKYIKTAEMYDADHDFELDESGNPVDENGEPVEHRVEAGVIAQQVLSVDELAFAVSPEGVDQDGTVTSPHGLDYNSLFTYAIAAIQEQQQLIEQLKSQNESLATRISALES